MRLVERVGQPAHELKGCAWSAIEVKGKVGRLVHSLFTREHSDLDNASRGARLPFRGRLAHWNVRRGPSKQPVVVLTRELCLLLRQQPIGRPQRHRKVACALPAGAEAKSTVAKGGPIVIRVGAVPDSRFGATARYQ